MRGAFNPVAWCFADTVSAPGGVAAGGDIHHSTITITGIPPEQLAVITEALKREQKLTDDQRRIIGDLQAKLGVSAGALQAFFGVLGEADVPAEKQPARLVEIAEDYNRVRQQAGAAPSDPPDVARLKGEASAALDAGELARADALLAQVLAAEDAAIEQRRLEAARTAAQMGGIALTRLRYREAAQHFAAAAGRVPAGHDDQRLAYLYQDADAFYRQGGEFGDNGALVEAIARYRALLVLRTRERVPLDWAMTQNNLGIAPVEPGRAGERDGAAGGGRHRLSGGAGGVHSRAGAAGLGHDPEQPRQCALDAGRADSR